MPSPRPRPVTAAGWWILFGVFCNCAGWGLSAAHQLNATGYGIAFAAGGALVLIFRRRLFPDGLPRWNRAKLRHRFKRLFPLAFLVLALMAILGGVWWPPGNPDGLTQRIPRVLHWLAEGRWHWIEKCTPSMNTHACGFEWLMAPMFAFFKTDRVVFVYNGIAYLLMPGVVFSLLRRLGVSPRAAWHWMWLAPAGLCFAMQAGSIGNDAAGALLAAAAVDFALRAKTSGRCSDVWLSIFAAALLSGMKTSNLALGLPWLVAIFPSLRLLAQRPIATVLALGVAAMSSLLPVMIFIHQHGGGWLGQTLESGGRPSPSLPVTWVGTGLNLLVDNFQPPIFPLAGWWNSHVYKLLPTSLLAGLERGFEPGAAHLETLDLQFEVFAGLGLGVCGLLVISWLAARCFGSTRSGASSRPDRHLAMVRWSAVISLLVFMAVMNVSSLARLVTPYYLLLLPVILWGSGHDTVVRRGWWRGLALATFLLTAVMLVLNPPRPLFPAQTLLGRISASHPQSRVLTRAKLLYESYAVRWDLLAPVRTQLPQDARDVGLMAFISGSPMETSLWRPFGGRRIWPLERTDTRADLDRKDIHYVVIAVDEFHPAHYAWMTNWVPANGGRIITNVPIRTMATGDTWPWYVIEFPGGSKKP